MNRLSATCLSIVVMATPVLGDTINFVADKVSGAYTVMRFEAQ